MKPKELPRTITALSGALMCIGVNIGAGVFVVPGIILQLVGSVGMVMILYVIGATSSILGTWAYVELGLMNPVSGGDKEYLELAFPRPKAFMSFLLCQVRCWMIVPGCSAAVLVASAEFMMQGIYGSKGEIEPGFVADNYDYISRGYSSLFMVIIMLLHIYIPRQAIKIQDSMVILKTGLLVAGVIVGLVAIAGGTLAEPSGNFDRPFEDSVFDLNAMSSAFLKVLFVFDGWNTLNYALSEVIEPEKNFPISAFAAIGTTSVLFIGFTIILFAVVPKVDIINPDNAYISSQFFALTLGKVMGSKVLPFMISLAAFSNGMCNTFAGSRLVFETAREGFLPHSSILSSISKYDSPANALIFNGVLSIFFILAPPPGRAYEFLIDLVTYPEALFYAIVVVGCCSLRFTRPEIKRPLKSTWAGNIIYIVLMAILAVIPFIPPEQQDEIPYWLSPFLGLASMLLFSGYYYKKVVLSKCMESSLNSLRSDSDLASDDIEASFGDWKKA
jgi:amino acid transporter